MASHESSVSGRLSGVFLCYREGVVCAAAAWSPASASLQELTCFCLPPSLLQVSYCFHFLQHETNQRIFGPSPSSSSNKCFCLLSLSFLPILLIILMSVNLVNALSSVGSLVKGM